jgi:general secretion pathway protein B
MSSILKALKKLEQEKAVRRGAHPDITRGILRNVSKGKMRPRWLFPLSVAGAAVAASLFTFALMAHFQPADRSAPFVAGLQKTVNVPIGRVPEEAASAAGSSGALRRSENQSEQVIPKVGRLTKTTVTGKSASTRPRQTVPPAESLAATPPPPAAAPEHRLVHGSATKVDQLMKNTSGHPVSPALTVTGIAWQKDSTDRMAIVNGSSVAEGVMVEGARVEKIFQDRVRFSFGTKTFDVSLGRTDQ